MFASRIKKTVTLQDGEETVTVIIRKLSHNSLEKASDVRQGTVAKMARQYGAEMMTSLKDYTPPKPEETKAPVDAKKSRYSGYDRSTVLLSGVESWSVPVKLSSQSLDDLDEETAQMLFEEILELSLPPVNVEEINTKD